MYVVHGLPVLLIYRPQRDGRLSWPGWLNHSGHPTLDGIDQGKSANQDQRPKHPAFRFFFLENDSNVHKTANNTDWAILIASIHFFRHSACFAAKPNVSFDCRSTTENHTLFCQSKRQDNGQTSRLHFQAHLNNTRNEQQKTCVNNVTTATRFRILLRRCSKKGTRWLPRSTGSLLLLFLTRGKHPVAQKLQK